MRRDYYHRLKSVIQPPQKKKRRLIAVDETKLKVEEVQVFVWVAVDVDTREVFSAPGRGVVWALICSCAGFSGTVRISLSLWLIRTHGLFKGWG